MIMLYRQWDGKLHVQLIRLQLIPVMFLFWHFYLHFSLITVVGQRLDFQDWREVLAAFSFITPPRLFVHHQ